MLTKKLACPSCHVNLKVADTLPPGKVIKCPKCGKGFAVPDDNEDSVPPKMVVVKRRKPIPPPEDDDQLDEAPKTRRVPGKRRKRRKKAASNTPLIVGVIIAGTVLVIGAAITLLVIFRAPGNKSVPVAENNRPPSGPAVPGPRAGRPAPPPNSGPGRQEPAASNPETVPPSAPAQAGVQTDRSAVAQAVFEANCTRCHSLGSDPSSGGRRGGRGRGPNLSQVGARRSAAWLMEHIRNPTSHNPNSKMPSFEGKINDDELRSLAEYLASLKG